MNLSQNYILRLEEKIFKDTDTFVVAFMFYMQRISTSLRETGIDVLLVVAGILSAFHSADLLEQWQTVLLADGHRPHLIRACGRLNCIAV